MPNDPVSIQRLLAGDTITFKQPITRQDRRNAIQDSIWALTAIRNRRVSNEVEDRTGFRPEAVAGDLWFVLPEKDSPEWALMDSIMQAAPEIPELRRLTARRDSLAHTIPNDLRDVNTAFKKLLRIIGYELGVGEDE